MITGLLAGLYSITNIAVKCGGISNFFSVNTGVGRDGGCVLLPSLLKLVCTGH